MFKRMEKGTKKSLLHGQQLYKVTVNGQSVHGGRFDYTPYLPTQDGDDWTPGDWTPEVANPQACVQGYHLTTDPWTDWAADGMTVYAAEGRGAYSATSGRDITRVTDNKLAFAQVRLLRPAEDPNAPAKQALAAALASIDVFADMPFLTGKDAVRPKGIPSRVFTTEREAHAAYDEAGGGKGYPKAKLTDAVTAAQLSALSSAVARLGTVSHDNDAFPRNLALAQAKHILVGNEVPKPIADRLAFWQAGFGVVGIADADGKVYAYRYY